METKTFRQVSVATDGSKNNHPRDAAKEPEGLSRVLEAESFSRIRDLLAKVEAQITEPVSRIGELLTKVEVQLPVNHIGVVAPLTWPMRSLTRTVAALMWPMKVMEKRQVELPRTIRPRAKQEIKCPYFEEVDGAYYCRANHVKKLLTTSEMQSFAPCTSERYRHCSLYQDWIYWRSRKAAGVGSDVAEQRDSVPAKV